ncbi:hypothetical protein HDU83_002431 [Entophlyctis luteolus]|nr:hypothetical protein HDU83_002431 [Entophlyctis luteolus]
MFKNLLVLAVAALSVKADYGGVTTDATTTTAAASGGYVAPSSIYSDAKTVTAGVAAAAVVALFL